MIFFSSLLTILIAGGFFGCAVAAFDFKQIRRPKERRQKI